MADVKTFTVILTSEGMAQVQTALGEAADRAARKALTAQAAAKRATDKAEAVRNTYSAINAVYWEQLD